MQGVVRLAKKFVPIFRAVRPIVQAMPRYLRRFLTPDGISRLNRELPFRRVEFIKSLKKSIAIHPAEAEVLNTHK